VDPSAFTREHRMMPIVRAHSRQSILEHPEDVLDYSARL
jgi:hypothetical protein